MSVTLAYLVAELKTKVTAVDGVPSDPQYVQAVKEAVSDYSSRNPLRKKILLPVISGTSSYTLPDDFYKIESLESLGQPGGVGYSASGKLIALSSSFADTYYIGGLTLTFDPAPAYSANRDLWYMARYILDVNDIYQDMTDEVARVVLLKAAALSLRLVADTAAGSAISYKDGDVSVDLTKQVDKYESRISKMDQDYEAAVDRHIGTVMVRGDGWYVC